VTRPAVRCVWLTGAAVPIGAVLGGFIPSWVGSRGEGPNALMLVGLILGGPLAALAAFLVTVPAVRVARPLRAALVMVGGSAALAAVSAVMLPGVGLVGASGQSFVFLFLTVGAVAAGFAGLALTLAARGV
jgi:hypothetical protein